MKKYTEKMLKNNEACQPGMLCIAMVAGVSFAGELLFYGKQYGILKSGSSGNEVLFEVKDTLILPAKASEFDDLVEFISGSGFTSAEGLADALLQKFKMEAV